MTYQVTSIWCNLSSLALLTYMCINCNFAVWRLRKIKSSPHCHFSYTSLRPPLTNKVLSGFSSAESPHVKSSQEQSSGGPVSVPPCKLPVRRSKSSSTGKRQETTTVLIPSKKTSSSKDVSNEFGCEQGSHSWSQTKLVFHDEKSNGVVKAIPSKKQNIKRLGNEHHVSIEEEDCMQQSSCDCGTACSAEYFSNSSDGLDCESQYTSRDTAFKQIGLATTTKSMLTCNGCLNEIENTQQGKSIFNREHSDVEYLKHNRKSVGNEHIKEATFRSCFCTSANYARDYVPLALFFLFACTLSISSLPVVGFGPRSSHAEKSCRSWLVPIPSSARERTFFIIFLLFVYLCLALGCGSAISVCMQVSLAKLVIIIADS